MTFARMELEDWFDRHQFVREIELCESAVQLSHLNDLAVSLDDVALRYGHHAGSPELREVIAADYPGLTAEDVIVTNGGSEAIFGLYNGLLEPNDRIVVEHPNYPSLYEIPETIGCEVVRFPLDYDEGFMPDVERLATSLTDDTRLLCITHPHNPTGSTISEDTLRKIVELCEQRGIVLLSDETYREMGFEAALPPAASLSPSAVSLSTMSKCYGLPGIRIGWMATQNRSLIERVLCVREYVTITNTALGERIALHVLSDKHRYLSAAKDRVTANKAIMAEWIDGQDLVDWVEPTAGVVGLGRLADQVHDPDALYERLIEQYGTMTIPGKYFGVDNRFFRLGFGGEPFNIAEGLRRFDQALADCSN